MIANSSFNGGDDPKGIGEMRLVTYVIIILLIVFVFGLYNVFS